MTPTTAVDGQPKQNNKTIKYWDEFYSNLDTSVQLLRESRNRPPNDGARLGATKDVNTQLLATKSKNENQESDKSTSELEWIAPNSPPVLDEILNIFPNHPSIETARAEEHTYVLEIGCGVSRLSRSLLEHVIKRRDSDGEISQLSRNTTSYSFVATDVSSVCLDINRERDEEFISTLSAISHSFARDSLAYELLDVLDETPFSDEPHEATVKTPLTVTLSHFQKYDVIIDKGTLDTFLFRSKRTKKSTSSHPPLLIPLLNNIHRFLKSGCNSKYIIISPRSKIKSVRDFCGFRTVKRKVLKGMDVAVGDSFLLEASNKKYGDLNHGMSDEERNNVEEMLDQQSNKNNNTNVYLYECSRNDKYRPGIDEPFRSAGVSIDDNSFCINCNMTFLKFRGNAEVDGQGEVSWIRRWNGHQIHCKGSGTCRSK